MKKHTLATIKALCEVDGKHWIWQFATRDSGASVTRHDSKTVSVRRLVRELTDGKPVAQGLEVTPRCNHALRVSPSCCLQTTTNGRFALAMARGAYSHNPAAVAKRMVRQRAESKYSDALIEQARTAEGTCEQVAERTGISLGYVKDIRSGKARRAFDNPFARLMA